MLQPFVWQGNTGGIKSPAQVERERQMAEALLAPKQVAQNGWEGISQLAQAVSGTVQRNRADEATQAGQEKAAALLGGINSSSSPDALIQALTSPEAAWLSPAQSQIGNALLSQGLEQNDPAYQLEMAYKQAQIDALARKDAVSPYLNVGGGSIFNTGSGEFMTAPGVGGDKLPTDVQEYNWYAAAEKEAGREPLNYLDFVNAQKGGGLTVTTDPSTGQTTVTQGGPGTKLTEGQGKDVVYFTRGSDANAMLTGLESKLTDWGQENAGKLPLGVGNYLREPEFRQAKIAADAFLAAVLRKDTGAAITDQEFDIYGPIFLPVPGDDPATIQMKQRMRDVALLAIKGGLGTADAVARANVEALGLNPDAPVRPGPASPAVTPAPAAPQSQANPNVIDWNNL